MRLKTVIYEDFANYRSPAMFIGTISCGGKCCTEGSLPMTVCINDEWRSRPVINIPSKTLCQQYLSNPITKAVVIGGLEPFEEFADVYTFIYELRITYSCHDPVVIFTGYVPEEISCYIKHLRVFDNIIIKFGRYVPGHQPHYDPVLGVSLASDNQYAERIS